jgi:O-acetyl-ADP-ribose deacetylase (regulator of RNase III)
VIHETEGDILLTRAQAIAHGVSPNDDFHQGLALSLREQSPALYKDFRHYCQTHHPEPGGLWAWMGADGKHVVSLFTQEAAASHGQKPGRARLNHVAHSLRDLAKLIGAEGWKSVALPRLATGVGGLAWEDVRPLIHQYLGASGAKVVVYTTYRKGVEGVEKL